jgi:hypothetical protein
VVDKTRVGRKRSLAAFHAGPLSNVFFGVNRIYTSFHRSKIRHPQPHCGQRFHRNCRPPGGQEDWRQKHRVNEICGKSARADCRRSRACPRGRRFRCTSISLETRGWVCQPTLRQRQGQRGLLAEGLPQSRLPRRSTACFMAWTDMETRKNRGLQATRAARTSQAVRRFLGRNIPTRRPASIAWPCCCRVLVRK